MKKSYILLGLLVLPLLASIKIINYFPDDAYFYLEIAKNIAGGNGITFGRVFDTNGFHPLWLCILVPTSYLFSGKATFLFTVFLAYTFLSIVAVLLLLDKMKSIINHYAALSIIPLSGILFCTGIVGTEAAISALTIVSSFYLVCLDNRRKYSHKRIVIIGVSVGLMMLARLDTVFIGGLVCLYLLYTSGIKKGLLAFLVSSLLVLTYIIFNIYNFGHLTPISGAVKSSFPYVGPHIGNTSFVHEIFTVGALFSAPFVLLGAKNKRIKGIVLVLVGGSFLQFAYHFLFSTSSSWYWYSVQSSIALGVCIPFVACSVSSVLEDITDLFNPKKITLSIVSIFIILSAVYINSKNSEERASEMIESIKVIENKVSDSSVVLAGDLPGMLGYYSDFKVVAVDGLTNNYEYFRHLRESGVSIYKEIGITHVFWRRGSRNSGVMQLDCKLGEWTDCRKGKINIYNRYHNDTFSGSIPIGAEYRILNKKMQEVNEHFTLWEYSL
jgi:hypothetical protein